MNAAIWAATIAAVVTVTGFALNQAWARHERRALAFADAMAALVRWEQIPFTIWRRPASNEEIRSEIGDEITTCFREVTYHKTRLRMESQVVGDTYVHLLNTLEPAKRKNQQVAWSSPVLANDVAMTRDPPFSFVDAEPARRLCLLAMRRELTLARWLYRVDTRRRLREQQSRLPEPEHRPEPDHRCSYFLIELARGAAWDHSRPRREQAGWDEHARFMDQLVDDGHVRLGGPVGVGDGDVVLLVMDVPEEADVRTRLQPDPWAGDLLIIQSIKPWSVWLRSA